MEIINLTPHEITFVNEEGALIKTIPASGVVARVSCETRQIGEINGIPVTKTFYGEVEALPVPEDGEIYIVSSLVAQHCKDREDIYIPNESVRDEKGHIISCKSLGQVSNNSTNSTHTLPGNVIS